MTTTVETAKAFVRARAEKNVTVCRELLAADYKIKSPFGSAVTREAALELIGAAAQGRIENSVFISEAGFVVHMYEWVAAAPLKGRFSMAENLVVDGGKIRSSSVVFDTAALPDDIRRYLAGLKQAA